MAWAQRKLGDSSDGGLQQRAVDNLVFIRETLDRSTSFTSVSGIGMVFMGTIACVGGWVATWRQDINWWINSWIATGAVACMVGFVCMTIKARRQDGIVLTAPARRFLLSFSPAIVAGCVLTNIFYYSVRVGDEVLLMDPYLPPAWLLLYGVAVMNGGGFSVASIPIMGVCFLVLGTIAALTIDFNIPAPGTFAFHDLLMMLGFGGLHVGFGAYIASKHGG